jgi:hypothetical protein
MIEENARNQTANQKKGAESQKCFRTQIEKIECIEGGLKLGSQQMENLKAF